MAGRRTGPHGAGLLQTCPRVPTQAHAANQDHGLDVYRFLRDEAGAQFLQFIPMVERDNDTGFQEGTEATDRSVSAAGYGRFMVDIFEEWVHRDVGRVYDRLLDVSLAAWTGEPPGLCVFAETCDTALAWEHNGDLYSCDHFVEPISNRPSRLLLENIRKNRES